MKKSIKEWFTPENRKFLAVTVILALFLTAALTDLLYPPSLAYLEESSRQGLAYLGAAAAVKIITAMFSLSDGLDQIITRIMNFLLITNGLLFAQLILLKVSKIILVKAVLALCFVLYLLFRSARGLLLRVLVLLFMINPGISLYVLGIKYITHWSKLDISAAMEEKLDQISVITQTDLLPGEEEKAPEETATSELEDKNQSLFTKFKNKLTGIQEKVTEKINQVRTFSTQKLKELFKLVEELLFLVIQYFVTALIQFLVLPLLYFYAFYHMFKRVLLYLDKS